MNTISKLENLLALFQTVKKNDENTKEVTVPFKEIKNNINTSIKGETTKNIITNKQPQATPNNPKQPQTTLSNPKQPQTTPKQPQVTPSNPKQFKSMIPEDLKPFQREKTFREELESDFANFQKEFRIACEPSEIIDKIIKFGCMNGIFDIQKSLPPTDFENLVRHLCPLLETKRRGIYNEIFKKDRDFMLQRITINQEKIIDCSQREKAALKEIVDTFMHIDKVSQLTVWDLKFIDEKFKSFPAEWEIANFLKVLCQMNSKSYFLYKDFKEKSKKLGPIRLTDKQTELKFKFLLKDLEDHLEQLILQDFEAGKRELAVQNARLKASKYFETSTLRQPSILEYQTYFDKNPAILTICLDIERRKHSYLSALRKKDNNVEAKVQLNGLQKELSLHIKKHQTFIENWVANNQEKIPFKELDTNIRVDMRKRLNKILQIAAEISLCPLSTESFNVVTFRKSEEDHDKIIQEWVYNLKNAENFKSLLPIYFNLLKRGENWQSFIDSTGRHLVASNKTMTVGTFQKKFLFYLIYTAANPEFKVRLLQLFGNYNPIPLVSVAWPDKVVDSAPYKINYLLYYIVEPSLGILSFGLGEEASEPIGKSTILNEIFHKSFSVNDNSPFHVSSIDIDFDLSFRPSRNFCIADAHGPLNLEYVDDFLEVFKVLIVHIHSRDLLDPHSQVHEKLKALLAAQNKSKLKPFINFIIRDYEKEYENSSFSELSKIYPALEIIGRNLNSSNFNVLAIKCVTELNESEKSTVHLKLQQTILGSVRLFKDVISLDKNIFLKHIVTRANATSIKDIDSLIAEFLNEMKLHHENYFSEKVFPCRNLMAKLREQQKILNYTKDEKTVVELLKNITDLENKLKKAKPSHLLKIFVRILQSPDSYMIVTQISKEIKNFIVSSCKSLEGEKDQLLKLLGGEKENKDIAKVNARKNELQRINDEISRRVLSIEVLWRELMTLYNNNPEEFQTLNLDPVEEILKFLEKGEPFELIDGDNLQFNENMLKKLFARMEGKMCNVCVLGPQSSGKSTLLNYLFGCQFLSSVGRCTKGIYISILRIKDSSGFKHLMILDSEGLQSVEKNDEEFDRKITLFCMAVSQIVTINIKGDIHINMTQLLEICTLSLHGLDRDKIKPSVYYAFNQNPPTSDKSKYMSQISTMMKEVMDANSDAVEEAQILMPNDDSIHPLGFAFQTFTQEVNELKSIWNTWTSLTPQSSFANECSAFAQIIYKKMVEKFNSKDQKRDSSEIFFDFKAWSDMANQIWRTIDRFLNLLIFKNIREMKQEREVSEVCMKLLEDYRELLDPKRVLEDKLSQNSNKKEKLGVLVLANFVDMKGDETIESNIKMIRLHYSEVRETLKEKLKDKRDEYKFDFDLVKRHEKELLEKVESYEEEAKLIVKRDTLMILLEQSRVNGMQSIAEKINKYAMDPTISGSKAAAEEMFEEIWTKFLNESLLKFVDLGEYDASIWSVIETVYRRERHMPQEKEKIEAMKRLINKNANERIEEKKELQTFQEYIIYNFLSGGFLKTEENNSIFLQEMSIKYNKPTEYLRIEDFYRPSLIFNFIDLSTFMSKIDWKKFSEKLYDICLLADDSMKDEKLESVLSYFTIFGFSIVEDTKTRILNIAKTYYQFSSPMDDLMKELNQYKEYNENSKFNLFHKTRDPNFRNEKEIGDRGLLLKGAKLVDTMRFSMESITEENINSKRKSFEREEIVIFKEFSWEFEAKSNELPDYDEGLKYSANPLNRNIAKNLALDCCKKLIKDKTDWKAFLLGIYLDIMKDIENNNQNLENLGHFMEKNNEMNADEANYKFIVDFSVELIKNVAKKVDMRIEKLNKELLRFCHQLSGTEGKGAIHLYSLMITWKMLCFASRKRLMGPIEKIKREKDKWRNYFVSSVCNDYNEKSVCFAQRIFSDFLKKLEEDKMKKEIIPEFAARLQHIENEFNVAKLAKRFESEILFAAKIDHAKVIDYVMYQNEYFEREFETMWNKFFQKVSDERTSHYKKSIGTFLSDVREACLDLVNYLELDQINEIHPSKIFEIRNEKGEKLDFVSNTSKEENQLKHMMQLCAAASFDLFHRFFTEGIAENWKYQEGEFKITFKNLKKPIASKIKIDFKKESHLDQKENSIPLIHVFLKGFISSLESNISSFSKISINWSLNDVGLDSKFQALKNKSIGCIVNCPTCNKKCDMPGDPNSHIHGCDCGHQIRGMFGVMVGNSLSSKSCDEITPESILMIDNTTMKWKDFVNKFPKWNLINPNQQKANEVVAKYRTAWKMHGPAFCEYYSKLWKKQPALEFSEASGSQSHHFILILDDSGSMCGSPWNEAKNGAGSFLQKLHEMGNTIGKMAISVIIFNHSARKVVEIEPINPVSQLANINYYGGGTEFGQPLQMAFDISKRAIENYERNTILFYTDGGAGYPSAVISNLKKESTKFISSFSFYALSQESNPNTLLTIAQDFRSLGCIGEVRSNISPASLVRELPEVLNSMFHKVM